ncbi:MAG: gamma-glutamyltransferase [Armatimonadetes bacterium]|nr:gamma-glutamyltransferase [Armatimonadota bacterium]
MANTGGAIVAPQPRAVEEGIAVLRGGGNAVDAAVATAFMQAVVDPQMCGVGGMGTMLIWPAGAPGPRELHFYGRAGSKVTPAMWVDRVRGRTRWWRRFALEGYLNDIGYSSIMTPATVAGLYHAHREYGRLRWLEVLAPAVAAAEEGFRVTSGVAGFWSREPRESGEVDTRARLHASPEAARIYFKPDDSMYKEGEVVKNPDHARSLRVIAEEGPEAFYHGAIARAMAEDLERNGAFITAQDLATYRVRTAAPLQSTYRGYSLYSNVPPGGGITVLQILSILEGYDVAALDPLSSEHALLLARAMQAAFCDRDRWVGDPEFVDVPAADLLSKDHATAWRVHLDAGRPVEFPAWGAGDGSGTTHVTVVDAEGTIVSLTHTLGSSSGVITPGLGFMYNNSMYQANPFPQSPNSIAPGKARTSGMCPTIVARDGKPVAALGAPGGNAIITGVLQALVNVLDHGMTATEAVSAPRIHCEGEAVDLEGRFFRSTVRALEAQGLQAHWSPVALDGAFARVQLIAIDPATGRLDLGPDPRGEGGCGRA